MKALQTRRLPIVEISPFGNIDLGIPTNRFFMMGFHPGDAVDVEFSNGFAFRNLPVFSGFYGRGDMPCLYVASSLYPHIGIGYPVSGNPWLTAGVKPGDTAQIILRRKRGFSQLEKQMRLPALLRPSPTRTPQQSANWRSLATGKISPGMIYRSCSPIRDDFAAAATACSLMKQAGIQSVLNLSDTPAIVQTRKAKADTNTMPYVRLFDESRVLPLHLGVDFRLQDNARTLARGLLWLATQPQPALIHCKLGLDRTGTACVLLEMLAGCSYTDIERDYQASYFNLFGPAPGNRQGYPLGKVRFKELLVFLLSFVQETQDASPKYPSGKILRLAARAYLAFGGLHEEQIDCIEHMLKDNRATNKEVPR